MALRTVEEQEHLAERKREPWSAARQQQLVPARGEVRVEAGEAGERVVWAAEDARGGRVDEVLEEEAAAMTMILCVLRLK